MTNSVRICVISHFALFREALAAVIRAEEGLEVVAECPTVEEAVETVEAAGVAVVLLDLSMWGRSGADLSNLRSNFPGNVVVMADQDCQVELAEAFSYGWTVLPWGSSCEQMIVALRVSGRQPV